MVIMIEPMYRTHRCPRNPVLGLGLSSDGGVRSRFHASTIVPGSIIVTYAVGAVGESRRDRDSHGVVVALWYERDSVSMTNRVG